MEDGNGRPLDRGSLIRYRMNKPNKLLPVKAILGATAILLATFAACKREPPAASVPQKSVSAEQAREVFLATFESGRFEEIGTAIQLLEQIYVDNPQDPQNTLLLALAHFWAAAESERSTSADPEMQRQHTELQLRYFNEAYALSPNDARILGWIGGSEVALSLLQKDSTLRSQGLEKIDRGVDQYPEFNHFIAAIVRHQLPPDNPEYARGVEAMWKTFDLCIGRTLDRNNPEMAPFMQLYTASGPKRACWSVPKALHSFEGFSLIMGDMVLKSGKPDQAKVLYQNAKLSHTYAGWNETFKKALQERMADNLEERAARFRDQDRSNDPPVGVPIRSCMICHQR